MILIIDNYDSFTYNWSARRLHEPGRHGRRNDAVTVDDIKALSRRISSSRRAPVIRRTPASARRLSGTGRQSRIRRLLGHQAICEVFGAAIAHAKKLMHGKRAGFVSIYQAPCSGPAREIDAARYHSLAAVKDTVPIR